VTTMFAEPEERVALRDAVAKLAGTYGREYVERQAAAGDKMTDMWLEMGRSGFLGVNLPEEYGGGGGGMADLAAVLEECATAGAPLLMMVVSPAICGSIIVRCGTEEQKRRWVPGLADGTLLMAFGITEADAGSNSHQITTTARRDGDEWVINGHKWFSSQGEGSTFAIVMCASELDQPPHRRMSQIVVPTDTPGFEIIRPVPVMGETDGSHAEIRYNDVRVPITNVLGEPGGGFRIAQKRLGPGRIHHCMRWLGQMQRAFELMVEYSLTREVYGSTLSEKQTVQNWIADSYVEIQAARALTLSAAKKIDTGDEARVEISAIKFFGAKILHDVIDRAIQVHGARGVSGDTPLESMYRAARGARIYDGPDETHRMVVSRRILQSFKAGNKWDFGIQ